MANLKNKEKKESRYLSQKSKRPSPDTNPVLTAGLKGQRGLDSRELNQFLTLQDQSSHNPLLKQGQGKRGEEKQRSKRETYVCLGGGGEGAPF